MSFFYYNLIYNINYNKCSSVKKIFFKIFSNNKIINKISNQELITRGYGYNLRKLNFLSKQDIETLFKEIKVLPGHKTKLLGLIEYINEVF